MEPGPIESILGVYRIDDSKSLRAYVLDGQPPRQTDTWFRKCEYEGKEFVILRVGTKDTRVFISATLKQLQDYLGAPPKG